jgi:hypothetical protein
VSLAVDLQCGVCHVGVREGASRNALGKPCFNLRCLVQLAGSENHFVCHLLWEGLVRAARLADTEIAHLRDERLTHGRVGEEVAVLVLYARPPRTGRQGRKPFDEHMVDPTPLAAHSQLQALGLQTPVEVLGGDLGGTGGARPALPLPVVLRG